MRHCSRDVAVSVAPEIAAAAAAAAVGIVAVAAVVGTVTFEKSSFVMWSVGPRLLVLRGLHSATTTKGINHLLVLLKRGDVGLRIERERPRGHNK